MNKKHNIESIVIEEYDVMNRIIDFDIEHSTHHALATICADIHMIAMDLYNVTPEVMAAHIFNTIRRKENEQSGGDICDASFSKY